MSRRGAVANVQDHDMVVNEFDLQSRYSVHFRINTHAKGLKLIILLALNDPQMLICDQKKKSNQPTNQ